VSFVAVFPDSFSGKVQIICSTPARPLQSKLMFFVEFSYQPKDLTRLFDDVGRLNEGVAEALRKNGATVAGVGTGGIRADGGSAPLPFLVGANFPQPVRETGSRAVTDPGIGF
jgi:hypothetical protein